MGAPLAITRAVVAFAAGVVALCLVWVWAPWQAAILAGWTTAAAVTVGWVLWLIWGKDGKGTAKLAMREDDSRVAADVLLVASSVGSLVGVALGLVKAGGEHGGAKAAFIGLTLLSVVLSWAVVHSVYTLRYANLYYAGRGGIDFGEDLEPDYRDFAYVAFTIGMTYQVSDTDLTAKPIRRAALRQALLAYVFGTFIVAVTINVVAGLL
jgi:uncharacterized membrane protein